MLSEKELIQGCISGDRCAQKELYEKYSPLFFATCLRYMPTVEDAEDVLIMGFTSIFNKLDTFKDEGSFEGWMRRIIINTAISTIRLNHKHYEWKHKNGEIEKIKNVLSENMIYSQISIKDILKHIQQLPTGYRMVFNLTVIEGYSYNEVANMMGIDKGTVGSQLARARKILQSKLQLDNE
jgi:RNA polymerase sigma-70 factor (ECF subfamily)